MILQLVFFTMMALVALMLLAILYKMLSEFLKMTKTTTETVATLQSSHQEAISKLANSVIQAMTEATTKSQKENSKLAETLSLGREAPLRKDEQATGGQDNSEPTPGIETYEGLSESMVANLRREEAESQQWRQLSQMPPIDLEDHLPIPNERVTPEAWLTS